MKLTIMERLLLLRSLPREGSLLTLKTLRVLRESLVPTDEERERFSITEDTENGQIRWNMSHETPDGEEVMIGEKATDIVVNTLRDLDAACKLTEQHLSLWGKFIGDA